MKKPLSIGMTIELYEIGTQKITSFEIKELIGVGASCIVYTAEHKDGEGNAFAVRLKEFYPDEIAIQRQGSNLVISDEATFSEMLSYFTSGYVKQLELRKNPEQMNSISNIQGIYTGNNTKYIAMSCNAGACLTDEAAYSFIDVMRIVRAVTKQIKHFHDIGYLYLDLKPNNIFLYPETLDMVMLFDFDSVIQKGDVAIHPEWLSYTEEWSAPELSRNQTEKIDERADIYAIGALLLFLLFHRSPKLSDRRKWASWDSEIEDSMLSVESPETKRMVTEILQKTLTSNIASRFSNCDALLDAVEPYLDKLLAPKPYLKTILPMGNNYFCGRDREISEIHEMLQAQKFLMLHGIGGIGKSELAKHYALTYAKDYDAVVFVRFQGNIVDTIASDAAFPLVNCQRGEDESTANYYNRKLQILQTVCSPRHLIILDNFDTEECDHLDDLTGLPCKILITSRIDYSDIFPQCNINTLDDFENIRSIFTHYWQGTPDEYVDDIIYALYGHTMGVELVSRQMQVAGISSKEMYERLSAQGISATEENVRNFKDGSIRNKSAQWHLEILFTVFGLSDELIHVLEHLAMFGTTVVPIEDFFLLCDFEEDEKLDFQEAVQRGWVQIEDDHMHLHPLICEVLLSQLKPDIQAVWRLVKSLEEGAETLDQLPAAKRSERERIMHHVSEHIYGEPAILVAFLRGMEKVYVTYQEYDRAEQCLLKRMELADIVWPDSPEQYRYEYYDLVDYAKQQGAYDRAEIYRQKANELVSEHNACLAKFFDSFADNDFEAAKEYALKLVELADNIKDLRDAYNHLADTEESMEANSPLVVEYGEKELHYAMECIEQNTDQDADSLIDLWSSAADACMHVRDYEKAVSYYQKVMELEEQRTPAEIIFQLIYATNLGIAYACIQNKAMAMQTLAHCLTLIQEHYLPEHPKYEELVERLAVTYNKCYQKTADEEYLYKNCEMYDLLLQASDDAERLGFLEIQYANILPLLGLYDECEDHIQKAITYYSSVYDEDDLDWIDVLSYVWQLLFICGNADWENHFDRLITLCEENDLKEVIEFNQDLLDGYTADDE